MSYLLERFVELIERIPFRTRLIGGFLVILLLAIMGGLVYNSVVYWGALYAQILGIAALIMVMNAFRHDEGEERDLKALRERLLNEIGSRDHTVSSAAIEKLRKYRWHRDGSMKNLVLWEANLQGLDFRDADLRGARLGESNLKGAHLGKANLQDAVLGDARLQNARLWETNLQGALLANCDLQNANLREANLQDCSLVNANMRNARLLKVNLEDADMKWANLHEADLTGAIFSESTILPDGTHWRKNVDIARFTDANHPEFWRPHMDADGFMPWWFMNEDDDKA